MKLKRTLSILCASGIITSSLYSNVLAFNVDNKYSNCQIFDEEPTLSHEQLVEKIMSDKNTISMSEYDFIFRQKVDNKYSDLQIFDEEPILSHEQLVEKISSDENTISMNEYDLILRQKYEAKMSLSNSNLSEEERKSAEDIIKFDPIEEINNLKLKTNDELKKMGMSDERIEKIKSFDGSQDNIRAMFANVYLNATNKCTKNESGYWAKVNMSFYWDDIPLIRDRDVLIASASTGFMAENVADTKASINYVARYNSSYKHTDEFTGDDMVINPFGNGNIAGFGFNYNKDLDYNAMSGSATLVFLSPDTNRVSLSCGYGHATITMPSIGINFSNNGVSIGLNFGLHEKYEVLSKTFEPQTIS